MDVSGIVKKSEAAIDRPCVEVSTSCTCFLSGVSLKILSDVRKAFLWILSEETTKDPFEQFADINVVSLFPAGTMSAKARHRHLKERLMSASDQVRTMRDEMRYLFSATHFGALFRYACTHFAETIERPFRPIKASKTYNPVARDLDEHLSTLLKHIRTPLALTEFAVPIIASSILLDNYPPGAHSKSLSFPIRERPTR